MEIYALLDLSKPPEKLNCSEGGQSFYHYFAPPLPKNVIMFATNNNSIQEQFEVRVSIDPSVEDKKIGKFSRDKDCFVWKVDLTEEEVDATNKVLKMDRLLKISVTKQGADEGFSSQDKDEEDLVFDNDNDDITEFEKSLEKFEDDFKENQSAIKTLHKKVASLPTKSSTKKKVSDFFKPKQQKKNSDFKAKTITSKETVLTETKDKVNGSDGDKEQKGKRPHPFVDSPESKPKKAMMQAKPSKTPEMTKRRVIRKSGKSPAAKFSDLISHENPTGRWGHGCCKICHDKAIVIGGQTKQQMNTDSMWLLDLKTRKWELQKSDNSTIDRRVGHSVVYDEKRNLVFVYGGSKPKKWYSDVYALNLATFEWEKSETVGKAPTRAYHSCNKFHDELFVFGGVYPNPDPDPDGCSNELVIYDIANKSWYTPIISGDIPNPRSGHSAVMIGSKLYIFGGWDAPTCHDDIYCLDIVIMKYTRLKPIGEGPSARTWHSTSVLSNPNQFCIYGGFDGNDSLNDLFVFDSVKTCWSKIHNEHNSILRAGHTSLLMTSPDSDDDVTKANNKSQVLIFGGGDNAGQFYNDVILLDVK